MNPYAFTGPYAACYRDRAMCMDERHVYTIFDVLTAWPFSSALELGCYDGASTSAFAEAIKAGALSQFLACDVSQSSSLWSVLQYVRNVSTVRYTNRPSWDCLAAPSDYDFILVDANHDMQSVSKELTHLIRRQPLCVMAHDTNATRMGYPKAEGAQHLADTFRKHPAYRGKCIEDAVRRQGEETHRGLFFATTDQVLYEQARGIFARRCPILEEVIA